jgi:hypothetical protein
LKEIAEMTDKSEYSRHASFMRLEDKVTDLWASVCSADFVFQRTVLEGTSKDDRVVIEMTEGEFSALSYLMANLYHEAKDFKESFHAEWEAGNSQKECNPEMISMAPSD